MNNSLPLSSENVQIKMLSGTSSKDASRSGHQSTHAHKKGSRDNSLTHGQPTQNSRVGSLERQQPGMRKGSNSVHKQAQQATPDMLNMTSEIKRNKAQHAVHEGIIDLYL